MNFTSHHNQETHIYKKQTNRPTHLGYWGCWKGGGAPSKLFCLESAENKRRHVQKWICWAKFEVFPKRWRAEEAGFLLNLSCTQTLLIQPKTGRMEPVVIRFLLCFYLQRVSLNNHEDQKKTETYFTFTSSESQNPPVSLFRSQTEKEFDIKHGD